MKVHLVASTTNPTSFILDGKNFNKTITMPLGMASIAAYLKQNGVEVAQTDLNAEVMYDQLIHRRGKVQDLDFDSNLHYKLLKDTAVIPEELRPAMLKADILGAYLFKLSGIKDPDIVGISCLYTMQFGTALLLAREIKRRTTAKVVFGGFEISKMGAKKYLGNYKFIDYFISEAGELPMLKLCEVLDNKGSLEEVPGLAFRKGSDVYVNQERAWIDLKTLPAPDFAGLPLEKYRALQGNSKLLIPYQFIRGCLFKCSFCRFPLHNKFLYKSPEQIVEEMMFLKQQVGSSNFFFLNNLVNIFPKFVDDLSQELKGKGVLWSDSARPAKLSRKNLENMRESGCIKLNYGLETASEKGEKLFSKGFTTEEARKVFKDSHDVGLWNGMNLIVAYPHQSKEDLQVDLDFITEHQDYINDVSPYRFNMGESPMLSDPEKYGIKIHKFDQMGYHEYGDDLSDDWNEIVQRKQDYLEQIYRQVEKSRISNFFGEAPVTIPLHVLYECYEKGLNKEQIHAFLQEEHKKYTPVTNKILVPSM